MDELAHKMLCNIKLPTTRTTGLSIKNGLVQRVLDRLAQFSLVTPYIIHIPDNLCIQTHVCTPVYGDLYDFSLSVRVLGEG
jgi:hypothetical protein